MYRIIRIDSPSLTESFGGLAHMLVEEDGPVNGKSEVLLAT